MIFDIKSFYATYQYDYYTYKLITLKRIIENIDKPELKFIGDTINNYSREDHLRILKMDIRQTVYQAIETVFELIFALAPIEGNNLDDKEILFKLTKSKWKENYKKIEAIAKAEDGLDFLDKTIKIGELDITVCQYLFYFGISPDARISTEKIESSIQAVKIGLKTIAQEFSNRKEYNSYKHAMRVIPAIRHISVLDLEKKPVANWDLSDSITFVHFKEDDEIEFITKLFDVHRDLELGMFCSNLMSNIILLRKKAFGLMKQGEEFPILFFGDTEVKEMSRTNVEIQDLIYKIKKVKKDYLLEESPTTTHTPPKQ